MLIRRKFLVSFGASPLAFSPGIFGFWEPNPAHAANLSKNFTGAEYLGSLANGQKIGLQITPTSPQRLAIHVFSGGLPGLGYDGLWQEILKGKQIGSSRNFKADGGGWVIEGNLESFQGTNQKGESLKAEVLPGRTNKNLGMKPPPSAKILFDGGVLDRWKRGRKDSDGNLQVGCETVDSFRDFLLHVEFRLPFLPMQKGQDRANSGVYIQNRYEIQILDSFALQGTKNECGSIYEFRAPAVNACLAPEQWQCYDIDFRSPRFENGKKLKNALTTVHHNGVLIHDKVEIPSQTGYGRKEGPEAGPIHLQNHGSSVVFRNIWILEK